MTLFPWRFHDGETYVMSEKAEKSVYFQGATQAESKSGNMQRVRDSHWIKQATFMHPESSFWLSHGWRQCGISFVAFEGILVIIRQLYESWWLNDWRYGTAVSEKQVGFLSQSGKTEQMANATEINHWKTSKDENKSLQLCSSAFGTLIVGAKTQNTWFALK